MQNQVSGRLVWSTSVLLLAGAAVASGQQYLDRDRSGRRAAGDTRDGHQYSVGTTAKLTGDCSGNMYFSAGNCVLQTVRRRYAHPNGGEFTARIFR